MILRHSFTYRRRVRIWPEYFQKRFPRMAAHPLPDMALLGFSNNPVRQQHKLGNRKGEPMRPGPLDTGGATARLWNGEPSILTKQKGIRGRNREREGDCGYGHAVPR